MSEKLLSVREAAARAGVSESLVYAWCAARVLIHYRFGKDGKRGCIKIKSSDLDEFLESLKVGPGPEAE